MADLATASRINADEVRHVAKLARLALDEGEVAAFTSQLDRILGFFQELAEVPTEGVPELAHPLPIACPLREDQVQGVLPREALMKLAPVAEGGAFRVPKILEG